MNAEWKKNSFFIKFQILVPKKDKNIQKTAFLRNLQHIEIINILNIYSPSSQKKIIFFYTFWLVLLYKDVVEYLFLYLETFLVVRETAVSIA